jgi:hypothetical protein
MIGFRRKYYYEFRFFFYSIEHYAIRFNLKVIYFSKWLALHQIYMKKTLTCHETHILTTILFATSYFTV